VANGGGVGAAAVVSRHISDPEKVQITIDRGAKFSTLGLNATCGRTRWCGHS
jgi:hypothetical protein